MFKFYFLWFGYVTVIGAFPLDFVKRIAEGFYIDDVENHLPRYDDVINYQYSTNLEDENTQLKYKNKKLDKDKDDPEIYGVNKQLNDELHMETTSAIVLNIGNRSLSNDSEAAQIETGLVLNTSIPLNNTDLFESKFEGNRSREENEARRFPRLELNDTKSDPEFASQEEGSSEEDGNMITGLLSAFLGGLSRPDGSIDLEAIIGLLGSLSTQNDDGTYDFQGLTDLLRGFFGGGDDEGGGSDIGSFLGGILGAVIKGVANPPGSKGAGIFTGKVITGILPALSAPPPAEDMGMESKPQGLDSGGFLAGLIKTVLSSSSGGNAQGGGGGSNIFKIIFQLITSVLSASSKSN